MVAEVLLHFSLGLIAAVIGALPFGLVNLSVVDSTLKRGNRDAFLLSVGSTFVEIVYVLLALFIGNQLASYMETKVWIHYFVFAILFIAGLLFLKKSGSKKIKSQNRELPALVKGAIYNLLSVQVLLYWFMAIAFLQTSLGIVFTVECILAFVLAVGIGKMGTLLFYRLLANNIQQHSRFISRKINLLIGGILVGLAIIQLIRIGLDI